MPWKCFLTERSELVRRSLRRYAGESKCPAGSVSYHNAEVVIDPELPAVHNEEGGFLRDRFKNDTRWPVRCACGYQYTESDNWQVNVQRLYSGAPDGKLHIIRELPIGAMWDAHWLDVPKFKGPDGKAWCVMMPGGQEWVVYGPSSNGKPWDVKGTPPDITAHPSIGILPYYHGYIRGGVITEDCDGRKFEGVPRTA